MSLRVQNELYVTTTRQSHVIEGNAGGVGACHVQQMLLQLCLQALACSLPLHLRIILPDVQSASAHVRRLPAPFLLLHHHFIVVGQTPLQMLGRRVAEEEEGECLVVEVACEVQTHRVVRREAQGLQHFLEKRRDRRGVGERNEKTVVNIAHSDKPIMKKVEVGGVGLVVEVHLSALANRLVRHHTQRVCFLVQNVGVLVRAVNVIEGLWVRGGDGAYRVGGDVVAVVHERNDHVMIGHGAGNHDAVRPLECAVLKAPQTAGQANRERKEVGVEVANEDEIGVEIVFALNVETVYDGRILKEGNVFIRIGRRRDGLLWKCLRNTHRK